MAKKKKNVGPPSGEAEAERFEEALKTDSSLRSKVQKHVDKIVDIAGEEGYSFTKDDMNNYLKRKHNPPPAPGNDTCFSEPPEM